MSPHTDAQTIYFHSGLCSSIDRSILFLYNVDSTMTKRVLCLLRLASLPFLSSPSCALLLLHQAARKSTREETFDAMEYVDSKALKGQCLQMSQQGRY